MAMMLKEQFKDKEFDLKAFSDMFKMGMDSIGVKYTVEETPERAHFTVTNCPQYDGWTQAGLSHEQIWRLRARMQGHSYRDFLYAWEEG